MKFLVVNMPCYGDNMPTAGFVKELVKKGHEVDVASSTSAIPRITELFQDTGARFLNYDMSMFDDYDPSKGPGMDDDNRIFGKIIEDSMNKSDQYDAVIYDYFAFPMYYITKKNVCAIRYFANFAFDKKLMERIFFSDEKEIFQNAHAYEIGEYLIETLKDIDFVCEDIGHEVINNIPDLNIVHTIKALQPNEENFDERFVYVGSSGSYVNEKVDIPFDKMKGKIIYVSFGTILTLVGDRRKDIFDKVIEAYRDEDVSVIMSIGDFSAIDEIENIPDNFYIYNFVPQTKVLEHSDLFITHCGMNSVNDSIYYGVPMIAIPGAYDQLITAELIEEKKLGYEIAVQDCTAEKLKELSFKVLNDEEIYKNVKVLQDEMVGLDCDRYTAELIENYAKEFKKNK